MSSFDITAVKDKVEKFVEQYPTINGPLSSVADKVKLDKGYIGLLVCALPVILAFIFGGANILVDLAAYVYPVYASIKAIESTVKDDDTLWLTYWIVFCLFKIFEGMADSLISFIPFYFIGKLVFLVWCYYPSTKGAEVLYKTIIKPYVVPALGLDKRD